MMSSISSIFCLKADFCIFINVLILVDVSASRKVKYFIQAYHNAAQKNQSILGDSEELSLNLDVIKQQLYYEWVTHPVLLLLGTTTISYSPSWTSFPTSRLFELVRTILLVQAQQRLLIEAYPMKPSLLETFIILCFHTGCTGVTSSQCRI